MAQIHNLASYGSRTRAKAKTPGKAPEPMSWHPWTLTRDLSLVLDIVRVQAYGMDSMHDLLSFLMTRLFNMYPKCQEIMCTSSLMSCILFYLLHIMQMIYSENLYSSYTPRCIRVSLDPIYFHLILIHL